jgi:hypothetical protein
MKSISLDIIKFAKKVEVPQRHIKTFLRHNFKRNCAKSVVELNIAEYRALRDYFTFERETVALIFFNPSRDKTRIFKNVIKLTKISAMRYRYEWFRYSISNGRLVRFKLGEIPVDLMEKQRIWRSPVDKTVVILNEEGQFEALSRLPASAVDN